MQDLKINNQINFVNNNASTESQGEFASDDRKENLSERIKNLSFITRAANRRRSAYSRQDTSIQTDDSQRSSPVRRGTTNRRQSAYSVTRDTVETSSSDDSQRSSHVSRGSTNRRQSAYRRSKFLGG